MNNTKVHIIIGNPNTGKTTTAWLVYLMLKEIGAVEYFRSFHDGIYEILPESQEPLDKIDTYPDDEGNKHAYDFCALVVVSHVRIAIFSAGDNDNAIKKGFEWLEKEKPHVYVGCCRNHGKSSARKKLNDNMAQYGMKLYRVYLDYENADLKHAIESRKTMAKKIVDAIL